MCDCCPQFLQVYLLVCLLLIYLPLNLPLSVRIEHSQHLMNSLENNLNSHLIHPSSSTLKTIQSNPHFPHTQINEDLNWKNSDPTKGSDKVKIALSLYKVQQNIYLLDFQRIEVRSIIFFFFPLLLFIAAPRSIVLRSCTHAYFLHSLGMYSSFPFTLSLTLTCAVSPSLTRILPLSLSLSILQSISLTLLTLQGDALGFMKLCALIITELKNLSAASRANPPRAS